MKINTDALLYYTRLNAPYYNSQDKEFFISIFFKYYALTGDIDSKEMMDINTINRIFETDDGRELNMTYAPNSVRYIQTAIEIAEDMTRKYKDEVLTRSKFYFNIRHDPDFGMLFLNTRLTDLYCKHMMKKNNKKSKANALLAASNKLGYEFCEWGSHSGHPSNLAYHKGIISKMIEDNYRHAVRLVACRYPFKQEPVLWADNLHSVIRYIKEYGMDARIKDIPFYVVDLTDIYSPCILANDGILRPAMSDIMGAVSSAYFRYEMSNSRELIDADYKIKDFLQDNPGLLK